MPLIDLVAAEYSKLHPGRQKPASQFSDELQALCSVLDRLLPQPQPEADPA